MQSTSGDGPAEWLARIEEDRQRTRAAIEPDPRLIYGAWGSAWLLGFLVLWSSTGAGPLALATIPAAIVFTLCMGAAIVFTAVHTARRVAGVRGASSRVGAMYGWAWALSFAGLAMVMTGAARSGMSEATGAVLWTGASGLLVGTLYLAGGALWQDRVQYGLGLWVLATSAASAVVGYPTVYLVMALAGGGGFLIAALAFSVRLGRSR